MGVIITTALLAYACGQIVNGLLTDRLGGKHAMLIGAAGTVVMNVIFGVASFLGLLWMFVTIRGIDGYLQAFGAPGMVKINAAWFGQRERGRFAGIFGFMINLGRFGIFKLGPALLAGFVFLGLWQIPPLHWRWLFWVPAGITAVVAICMAFIVKDTPEQAGFPGPNPEEVANDARLSFKTVFVTIASNPVVWVVACAYACTGAVRQGIDQWFPRFMSEAYHVDFQSAQFQLVGFLIPFVASAGSLVSGYVSDTLFQGRRAPVAAGLYLIETAIILLAAQFHTVNAAVVFLVLISFTANATHSILGTAAAMDIGGAKMAGFATGVIDSFQYFGGSLAGYFLGALLDKGWGGYFYFMAPFGAAGGMLMLSILGRVTLAKPTSSAQARGATSCP
jgi:OPA family glycerol-3-phosphate transporter-like MFS transporter